MLISEIQKGTNIELEVKYIGQTMSFRSDIVDIFNNSIFINPIIVNDQTLGFTDQAQINFIYLTDGKVYVWENMPVKLVKFNGKVCHMIELSGAGKPYNRRSAYRLYIGEEMPLYVNTAHGPTAVSVLVKDLSETGVAFISKDEFDIDRTIRLKLKEKNYIINIPGVIVRKVFLENLGSFLYGCKFTEKSNKLGSYIYKRQIEQLQKKNSLPAPAHDNRQKHMNHKNPTGH